MVLLRIYSFFVEDILSQTITYLTETFSQSKAVFTAASPFGQILLVTERLHETSPEQFEAVLKHLGLLDYITRYQSGIQLNSRHNVTTEFAWANLMDTSTFRRDIRNLSTDKHFKDAMRILEPLFARKGFYADVHLANMMIRSNGQLVFNDPLAIEVTD